MGLVWIILILALVAGCTWLAPQDSRPSESGTTGRTSGSSSSPTGLPTSAQPTLTTSSGATSVPKTTGPPSAGTSGSPSTGTIMPTTGGPTSATTAPTTIGGLTAYSASPVSWSYIVPKPLNQGIRATIPAATARLIAPWPVLWQAATGSVPTVYLTMDEGYEFENNTAKILDIAREKSVSIAFFVTGSYLRAHPDLVRRMLDEGHLVLNHTDQHPDLAATLRDKGADAVLSDIRKLETEFRTLTGRTMLRLIRPPAGVYSQRLLALLARERYTAVFWSFAYRDWLTDEQPAWDSARSAILGQLHDGSVLLLHAVSNTNVQLLPELIDAIRARGYRIGILSEIT